MAEKEEMPAENGVEESQESEVRKCVQNLPWKWTTDAFKRFLKDQDVVFSSAKKRKGCTNGFISFEKLDDAEKLEITHKGKKLKVSDALPRNWETDGDKAGEKGSKEETGDTAKETNEELKDIRDVVTPLWTKLYGEQLQLKKDSAIGVLKKFARHTRKCCAPGTPIPDWLAAAREKGGLSCDFEGIVSSPIVDGYRNKCEFSIGMSSEGNKVVGFQLGMFRNGITAIGSPSDCPNVSDIAKFYASALEQVVCTSELQVWDKEKNTGFWRMLTVREGRHPRTSKDELPSVAEVMVIVQVSPSGIADDVKKTEYERIANDLAAAASQAQVTLTALLVQEHVGVSNAAPSDAPLVPLALPGREENAQELGQHIHDYIADLRFRISPTAFFQVNSFAAEKLYALAGEWAGLGPQTLLFDVCCGTGTIGLTLARKVGMVVGIELNADAVADAWTNAKLNNITNCKFVCGKAEDVINGLLNEYEVLPEGSSEAPDDEKEKKRFSNIVVVVDPPRSGLHPSVVKALRSYSRLKRLVYISCNPDTLVANSIELCAPVTGEKQSKGRGMNIKGMSSMGYARQRVKNLPPSEPFSPIKAVAVDLFPHTHHCEMVMLLQR